MPDAKATLAVEARMKDLASKDLRSLGSTGKRAGQSIAAGFLKAQLALGAFKLIVRKTIGFVKSITTDLAESADEVGKFAGRIGISTEALSEFHHVADLAAVETRSFNMAMQRMVRRVAEAAQGTGEAQKAIAELGISAKELAALAPEDQFMAVARALEGVESNADRVRLAMKFFDAEGVALLQIINQGTEAIAAQRIEAHKLGVVYSQELTEDAAEFNDALDRMGKSFQGVKMVVARELLPELTEMFRQITEWVVENRGTVAAWAKEFVDDAIPAVKQFAKDAMPVLEAIAFIIDKMAAGIRIVVDNLNAIGRTYGQSMGDPNAMGGKGRGRHGPGPSEDPSTRHRLPVTVVEGQKDQIDIGAAAIKDFADNVKVAQRELAGFELGFKQATLAAGDFNYAMAEIGYTVGKTITDDFADAVIDVQRGAKSMKEAFREMAMDMVFQIQKVIIKLTVMNALNKVANLLGFPSLFGASVTPAPTGVSLSGSTSGIVVNQTINPSPGMDERELANQAASAIESQWRASQRSRTVLRRTARGGLL